MKLRHGILKGDFPNLEGLVTGSNDSLRKVGRVTPCAPLGQKKRLRDIRGAHRTARPTTRFWAKESVASFVSRAFPARRSVHAYLMTEALVYISVLFLLLGVGYIALYRCMNNSTGLRRNADDIVNATRAGERWRTDLRAAKAPPRVEQAASEQILRMETAKGTIVYRFADNVVFRRVGDGTPMRLLENVKSSAMTSDPRQQVNAWRWEVELLPRKKTITRTRPLFTFIAVPSGNQR
jgi:hypothetical protein